MNILNYKPSYFFENIIWKNFLKKVFASNKINMLVLGPEGSGKTQLFDIIRNEKFASSPTPIGGEAKDALFIKYKDKEIFLKNTRDFPGSSDIQKAKIAELDLSKYNLIVYIFSLKEFLSIKNFQKEVVGFLDAIAMKLQSEENKNKVLVVANFAREAGCENKKKSEVKNLILPYLEDHERNARTLFKKFEVGDLMSKQHDGALIVNKQFKEILLKDMFNPIMK